MKRVAIVGAGVIGLSAALHLLERFPGALDITVISEKFSPNVTSDKAGVLLVPFDFRNEDQKKESAYDQAQDFQRWTRATFQKYHSIYRSEENAEVQICLEQGYLLYEEQCPDPWYKEEVFGFRHVALDSVEARLLHLPPQCVDVWSFSTYIVEATSYMQWLMKKVKRGGATFQEKKIFSFDELSSYDVIINCTGIGSCELLDDKLMQPVRGQTVIVKAPWLTQWLVFYGKESLDYIFPRAKDVILGGTLQAGNWNENPDPKTTQQILSRCRGYFPSLCSAEVVKNPAGLRPLRDPIRLESCEGPAGSLLIHCYGHGGQGIVLSWGCAQDIGDIVQRSVHCKSSL